MLSLDPSSKIVVSMFCSLRHPGSSPNFTESAKQTLAHLPGFSYFFVLESHDQYLDIRSLCRMPGKWSFQVFKIFACLSLAELGLGCGTWNLRRSARASV